MSFSKLKKREEDEFLILSIMRDGGIRRSHTTRMLHEDFVGEHSWGVAMIILRIDEEKSHDLLKAAILHDVGESYTGDILHFFKKELDEEFPGITQFLEKKEAEYLQKIGMKFPKLTERQLHLLKYADIAHYALVCLREVEAGNEIFRKNLLLAESLLLTAVQPTPSCAIFNRVLRGILNTSTWEIDRRELSESPAEELIKF